METEKLLDQLYFGKTVVLTGYFTDNVNTWTQEHWEYEKGIFTCYYDCKNPKEFDLLEFRENFNPTKSDIMIV